jgi:hypothetical protein
MLKFFLILEDLVLTADYIDSPDLAPNSWSLEIHDRVSGQSMRSRLSPQEMAALQYLIALGDDSKDLISKAMSGLLEPVMKDWPKECRPIP